MSEKLGDVRGELGDGVPTSKLFSADLVGFLLGGAFIEEPEAMEVLVEEDVEDVRFQEIVIGLGDSSERGFVHDNDVGGDRIVCSNESLKRSTKFLQP